MWTQAVRYRDPISFVATPSAMRRPSDSRRSLPSLITRTASFIGPSWPPTCSFIGPSGPPTCTADGMPFAKLKQRRSAVLLLSRHRHVRCIVPSASRFCKRIFRRGRMDTNDYQWCRLRDRASPRVYPRTSFPFGQRSGTLSHARTGMRRFCTSLFNPAGDTSLCRDTADFLIAAFGQT